MKNSFKKIIGIGLLSFVLGIYGATAPDTEIQQRFDNVSGIYKMSIFDRLLDEGNVLLLGPALINNFLNSLPTQKRSQKALLLCQQELSKMPIALAVKCISFLPRAEDKIHYSERLLRERDLNSLEWWGFFIGGQYSASRRLYDIRWHGYELLGYFPVAKKIELVEMILEKYWDCFSISSTENFSYTDIPFLIAYFPIRSLQRVLYVKRCLETKDYTYTISYDLLDEHVYNLCSLVNREEQNALVIDLFAKKFDALPLDLSLCLFSKLTEKSDKIVYGKRLLLSKKHSKEKLTDFDKNFFVKDVFDEETFLVQFIEEYFDILDTATLLNLISQLGLKRMHYLNQLIVSKKIENLSEKQIDLLFWGVSRFGRFAPDESTTSMAILLLDRFFETSSASVIVSLLNKISEKSDWKAMLGNALFGTVRKKYFHRLVASGKLKSESDFRNTFLGLSKDERKDVVTVFKKSLDTVTSEQAFLIFNYVSDKEKEAWLRKNNVFWKVCCSDDPKATGPLFSKDFLSKNDETIINFLKKSSLTGEKVKHVKLMMSDFKEFMEEQYRQDRIVFLHGQQDQWAFLAGIFDDLITIKYGHSIPEDFVRLRFQERSVIESDDVVRATREKGIPSREAFKDVWFHLLFTNLHLLANEEGSNTLLYFLENYDQTTKQNRFDFNEGIKKLFSELAMLPEYDALIKEMPTLFTDLYGAYKKDVIARGDIGRLIAISMPKDVAQRLAYSSTFGGPHKSIDIDGKPTVDVVKIGEKFGQAPFENEHCVIMSKEMTDPYNALEAGIKMVSFVADSNEKSLPLADEFQEKRTAFKSCVTSLYRQRKEAMRRFKKSCPYALGYNPFTVAAVEEMVKK